MTIFEIIFLVALSLYLINLIVFTIGASKNFEKIDFENLPTASVIVAARNEENNILDCLEALDKLKYPENKLEIIIVNDHSTDRTEEIVKKFIEGKQRFKLYVPEKKIGKLKGKANALANALKVANGEVILTTDADCIVNPNWAITLCSYYQNDVAFVGGFTTQEDKTAFQAMQAIDFIFLLTVAAGSLNLGKPLAAIGNNMSYRKSVYDEIGGYENLPFSITEDFLLLKSIHKLKKYKCIYPIDENSVVTSKACDNFRDLYWQRKRWGVGGKDSDLFGYLVMVWGYISKLMIFLSPLFFTMDIFYLIFTKFMIDYFFAKNVFNKLKLNFKLIHFIVFEIYYTIYVLILPFIVLPNKTVKWKGRTF